MTKQNRQILLVGILLILCAFLCVYIRQVWHIVGVVLAILSPFIAGAAVAFVLNVPMRFFENKALRFMDKKRALRRFKRPLAVLIVVLLLLAVVTAVVLLLIPRLAETAQSLWNGLPGAIDKLIDWLAGKGIDVSGLITSETQWDAMTSEELKERALSVGKTLLKGIAASGSVIGKMYTNVLSLFFTVMFTLYFLFGKERLTRQVKRLLYCFLPERAADQTVRVARMAGKTYASFITGQCLEAVILGLMFFVAMTCFGFEYALLISVIIAVTALVPVVGAWIGCIAGAFLILTVNPLHAAWFVLLFVVLQQIEGNVIYPRVMGNAVGLPAIWVLLAVIVGEGLLGILGMLLFIPLASVGYTLLRGRTQKKLEGRQIAPEKLA